METATIDTSIFSEQYFDSENQVYAVPFKKTPYNLVVKTYIAKSWVCPYKVLFTIQPFVYTDADMPNGYITLTAKGKTKITETMIMALEKAIELKLVELKNTCKDIRIVKKNTLVSKAFGTPIDIHTAGQLSCTMEEYLKIIPKSSIEKNLVTVWGGLEFDNDLKNAISNKLL